MKVCAVKACPHCGMNVSFVLKHRKGRKPRVVTCDNAGCQKHFVITWTTTVTVDVHAEPLPDTMQTAAEVRCTASRTMLPDTSDWDWRSSRPFLGRRKMRFGSLALGSQRTPQALLPEGDDDDNDA